MDRKGFLSHSAPWLHFLFLVGLIVFSMFLFSTLSIMTIPFLFDISFLDLAENMQDLSKLDNTGALKYMQITQSLGMFVLPPLVYFQFAGLKGSDYLVRQKRNLPVLLGLTILLGMVSMPLVEGAYQLNQLMDLPAALDRLEAWMREYEQLMEELTATFVKADGWGEFFVNMLMIAVIPAIGEELTFRGALQKIFSDWFKNPHWAILLTSFLFAFIHLQFFGFLPRFLLGLSFGYLFFWSRNIWVPITAHFLNNGAIVVAYFLFQQKISNFDPGQEQEVAVYQYLLSAVLTPALLVMIYRMARKREQAS